jgi:hypothetical protein
MLRSIIAMLAFVLSVAHALAQERQWSFDQTDKDAYLVFGVPETDDVGLSFWCTQRSGRIKLFFPESGLKLKPKQEMPVRLDVASKTFRFKATSETNVSAGTASLEAELPIDHPLFAAIASADRITVRVNKRRDVFPLQDLDLSGLIAVCRG